MVTQAVQLDLLDQLQELAAHQRRIEELDSRIDRLDDQGVDTHYLRQELAELLRSQPS